MSSKFVRFFGVALVLCCATLFTIAQDAKTADSIQKQADDVTKKDWKALSKQGEALAKTHDLADVMNLMRTRKLDEKGNIEVKTSGVGVGKEPGKIKPDGIEAKIINMKRNPMPAGVLASQQADLIRMAEITAAIASVSVHQCVVDKKMGEKDPAMWKKWMEDMHTSAVEMVKAAKAKNAVALRDAAKKAHDSCLDCHKVFRDDK